MVPVLRKYSRLLGAILVVAISTGVTLAVKETHKTSFTIHTACDILTPTVARQAAGTELTKQPIKDSVTDDTRTTFCVYRGATSSVSLAVRAARNSNGRALNHSAFSAPVGGSVKVSGYGDAAYWAPTFAQLNILDHDTWYIISSGSNVPAQRTIPDAKKLANLMSADL